MERTPQQLLADSELILSEDQVGRAIEALALDITREMSGSSPLVLCVMTGGLYLAGALLPRLSFPLTLDYVHATRYRGRVQGEEVVWLAEAHTQVVGRHVLLVDDILDEGHTLAAIRERLMSQGALGVRVAVLVEKVLPRAKPIVVDFVGLQVPDRYVFGCGMDVYGWWRNLPGVWALK